MRPVRTVDYLLRLEWIAVAVAAMVVYAVAGGSWTLFLVLILAPDLSMLGYLAGARVGAIAYNTFHILVWPVLLLLGSLAWGKPFAFDVAVIWTAHIAVDRALGYGLKLPEGFQETHLGRIGR